MIRLEKLKPIRKKKLMPYRIDDFLRRDLYEDKPGSEYAVEFEGGRVSSSPNISKRFLDLLNSIRGPSYGGDPSRQDSALITALLSSGLSPGDTYQTFINSVRGGDAKFRKPGHVEDYVKRTIQKSLGYLKWASSNGN